MNKHILKANKVAKKALDLFDMAIKGLEEANEVLSKGTANVEGILADLFQDKARIDATINEATMQIVEHEKVVAKNLQKIQKIKDIFGE